MTRPRLLSTITLLLLLLFSILTGLKETQAAGDVVWWDTNWPFRIPLEISETGKVQVTLNFSQVFNDLGLEDALLDLRSLQVIPYIDGLPGEPVPYEETFSQLIIDADEISKGTPPDNMFWMFLTESTEIEIDNGLKTEGDGSLHAHIEISETSQAITGFYFDFNNSFLGNWSEYEVLLYDIYPDVNEVTATDIESLFSFKLEGLNNCTSKSIECPSLVTNGWNELSLILQPFGMCESPDYSSIDMIKFIFQRGGNDYLDIGDNLDIWVDYFRLFDQDADGQIIWNAEENVDYYLYFDLLKYGETQIFLPLVLHNK